MQGGGGHPLYTWIQKLHPGTKAKGAGVGGGGVPPLHLGAEVAPRCKSQGWGVHPLYTLVRKLHPPEVAPRCKSQGCGGGAPILHLGADVAPKLHSPCCIKSCTPPPRPPTQTNFPRVSNLPTLQTNKAEIPPCITLIYF